MSDQYEGIRNLSPIAVLAHLGFDGPWKSRKGGQEHGGRCPIHNPAKNTSSFSIHEDGRYACFSCGAKGKGSIDLWMAVRKCGFQEAVKELQAFVGSPAFVAQARKPEIKLVQEVAPSENPPFKNTYSKYFLPYEQSTWLKERGLTEATLNRYGVGIYDNPKRVSIYKGKVLLPIRRFKDGECVGYLSRNVGEITPENPKYLFAKGVHKSLEVFGAYELKNEDSVRQRRLIYLVESPFAVMKFAQMGLPAVSCYGWSVSAEQIAILQQLAKGVVFLPDADKYQEAQQYVPALARALWVKAPALPPEVRDPELLTLEQVRSLTGAS